MTKCSNGSSRKNPVPKNRPTTLRTRISICSWCATDETFTKYQNSPATIDLQDRILHALEKKDALNAGMFGVGTNPLVQADAIRSKDLRALREGFASALKSSNAMVRAAVIMNPLVTVANLRLMMSDKDEVASFVLGASGRFENPEDIVKMANSTNYYHRLGLASRPGLTDKVYLQLAASDALGTIRAKLLSAPYVSQAVKTIIGNLPP